jgi:ribose transport system permease protein
VPWLLVDHDMSPWVVLPLAVVVSVAIGLLHGVLVTVLRIQPFIVTLCGLLLYRGIARWITDDQTVGFRGAFEGLQSLGNGRIEVPFFEEFALPTPFLILVGVAVLAIVFLRWTVWGRWMLATGRNESAARYAGIPTRRVTIFAYVVCSVLAGIGGMLFVFDVGSAQPADFGSFYELYAIAAAVLGGCSLRGGEGTIIGVILGAALMQVLRNAITLIDWIPDNVEFAVIGGVILVGAIADELVQKAIARRGRGALLRAKGDDP